MARTKREGGFLFTGLLFPHLAELGIKVAVDRELPKAQQAYQGYLRQMRDAHRVGMVKPTA